MIGATHLEAGSTARRRCWEAVAMPLTGRSRDQRGGDHRVYREPVVRGLAFRSYFSSTPSVCNPNLTMVQRALPEDRSLPSGESLSYIQHSKGFLQASVCVCACPNSRWAWKLKLGRQYKGFRRVKRSETLWAVNHGSLQTPWSPALSGFEKQGRERGSKLTLYSFTQSSMTSSFRWYPGGLMERHDQQEDFEPDGWGSDGLEQKAARQTHSGTFILDPFSLNCGQLNFLLGTTPKSRLSCVVWLCWDSFFPRCVE